MGIGETIRTRFLNKGLKKGEKKLQVYQIFMTSIIV